MEKSSEKKVSEAAKMLSKLGASKGGKARAKALTPEERQAIAREAIATRWARDKSRRDNEDILTATHGSPDHPLRIGDMEIPCFVLEDGRRVLVQRGMIDALGMSQGTATATKSGDRLAKFATGNRLSSYISKELVGMITEPIRFRTPGGNLAYGYEATILADICEAVLTAREAGVLQKQQQHIAAKCEILVRGFARVGIIALVDEATGYQAYRSRQALEEILEQFIAAELRKWAKTFPDEFYQNLFRLKGWQYIPFSVKRPIVVSKWTTDIVYKRLAPGVLEELKRITPRDAKGRLKHKYFQRLTEDVGHPRLREHLASVTALMRASTDWKGFYRLLERAFPRFNHTMLLPFPEIEDEYKKQEEHVLIG